jgi:hypothetical protein
MIKTLTILALAGMVFSAFGTTYTFRYNRTDSGSNIYSKLSLSGNRYAFSGSMDHDWSIDAGGRCAFFYDRGFNLACSLGFVTHVDSAKIKGLAMNDSAVCSGCTMPGTMDYTIILYNMYTEWTYTKTETALWFDWNYTLDTNLLTSYHFPDSVKGSVTVPDPMVNPAYYSFNVTRLVNYAVAHPDSQWGFIWIPKPTVFTAPAAGGHVAPALDLCSFESRASSDSNMSLIIDGTINVKVEERGLNLIPSSVTVAAKPNPFTGSTSINFALPSGNHTVSAAVYDLSGRKVMELMASGRLNAGFHSLAWNGRDGAGLNASSGIYMVGLKVDGKVYRQRLVLSR